MGGLASCQIGPPTMLRDCIKGLKNPWEVLTQGERADLLGGIVQVVGMTEKESVTLKLHQRHTL